MCECGGWLDTAGTIICEGCEYWRTQHGFPCGPQHPCKEKIGRAARSANRNLCHYCNEALIKHSRAFGLPPLATTPPPPLHPPTAQQQAAPPHPGAATPPLATTPPPHPPTQGQPALPLGAAAAAALADATATTADANSQTGLSQSSRGSLQQPTPVTADATPQLREICARLDALEEICGRMETMMMGMCVAISADGAQSQARDGAQSQAPQGLADGAQPDISQAMAALDVPPGLQAQAPLQAQAAAGVVAVNVPGADNGGQGSHASWTAGVQPSHSPIHPQPHKNTKHNLNKHKSNNHRHRRPLKLMREV